MYNPDTDAMDLNPTESTQQKHELHNTNGTQTSSITLNYVASPTNHVLKTTANQQLTEVEPARSKTILAVASTGATATLANSTTNFSSSSPMAGETTLTKPTTTLPNASPMDGETTLSNTPLNHSDHVAFPRTPAITQINPTLSTSPATFLGNLSTDSYAHELSVFDTAGGSVTETSRPGGGVELNVHGKVSLCRNLVIAHTSIKSVVSKHFSDTATTIATASGALSDTTTLAELARSPPPRKLPASIVCSGECTIEGITLQGLDALRIESGHTTLRGVRVIGTDCAIHVETGASLTLERCSVELLKQPNASEAEDGDTSEDSINSEVDPAAAIVVDADASIRVSSSTVDSCNFDGVYAKASRFVSITASTFKRCALAAVVLDDCKHSGQGVRITGNTFMDCHCAVYTKGDGVLLDFVLEDNLFVLSNGHIKFRERVSHLVHVTRDSLVRLNNLEADKVLRQNRIQGAPLNATPLLPRSPSEKRGASSNGDPGCGDEMDIENQARNIGSSNGGLATKKFKMNQGAD